MKTRPPHVATCTLLLAAADLALKTLGLRRVARVTRWVARPASQSPENPRRLVSETARQVATAAAFYPGRAQCLEQSLTLFLLLRRRGVPVELRIGIQPFPFMAHAWVEHDGRPVNEPEDFVTRLAPFPSIGG
jgi:hypothetical protein